MSFERLAAACAAALVLAGCGVAPRALPVGSTPFAVRGLDGGEAYRRMSYEVREAPRRPELEAGLAGTQFVLEGLLPEGDDAAHVTIRFTCELDDDGIGALRLDSVELVNAAGNLLPWETEAGDLAVAIRANSGQLDGREQDLALTVADMLARRYRALVN